MASSKVHDGRYAVFLRTPSDSITPFGLLPTSHDAWAEIAPSRGVGVLSQDDLTTSHTSAMPSLLRLPAI